MSLTSYRAAPPRVTKTGIMPGSVLGVRFGGARSARRVLLSRGDGVTCVPQMQKGPQGPFQHGPEGPDM